MKVVFVEQDRCLACRNCERVCSFQETGGFLLENTSIWVQIDLDRRIIYTLTCLQCETAACLEICPAGAISRHPQTHALVVDEAVCVGCRRCVTACPFGNIRFDQQRRVAIKCNLCHGQPQCVLNCMAGALHYADINELARVKRGKVSRTLSQACLSDPSAPCS